MSDAKAGDKTGWSERSRDYRLRTVISYEELFVRQLGAKDLNGWDNRRLEIFKVRPEKQNPDQCERIILNPHQVAALIAALQDHMEWRHDY